MSFFLVVVMGSPRRTQTKPPTGSPIAPEEEDEGRWWKDMPEGEQRAAECLGYTQVCTFSILCRF